MILQQRLRQKTFPTNDTFKRFLARMYPQMNRKRSSLTERLPTQRTLVPFLLRMHYIMRPYQRSRRKTLPTNTAIVQLLPRMGTQMILQALLRRHTFTADITQIRLNNPIMLVHVPFVQLLRLILLLAHVTTVQNRLVRRIVRFHVIFQVRRRRIRRITSLAMETDALMQTLRMLS